MVGDAEVSTALNSHGGSNLAIAQAAFGVIENVCVEQKQARQWVEAGAAQGICMISYFISNRSIIDHISIFFATSSI